MAGSRVGEQAAEEQLCVEYYTSYDKCASSPSSRKVLNLAVGAAAGQTLPQITVNFGPSPPQDGKKQPKDKVLGQDAPGTSGTHTSGYP